MPKIGSQIRKGSHLKGKFSSSIENLAAVWDLFQSYLLSECLIKEHVRVQYGVRVDYKDGSGKFINDVRSKIIPIAEVGTVLSSANGDPAFSVSAEDILSFSLNVDSQSFNLSCREPGAIPADFDRLVSIITSLVGLRNAMTMTDAFAMDLHMRFRDDEFVKILCSQPSGRYEHSIAHEMWFGETFWDVASCTKDDVIDSEWLKVEDRGNHLHVVAWPEPFSSTEGAQGNIQRKLLKLLFNKGTD